MKTPPWHLRCVLCDATYAGDALRYRCDCGETLDVIHTQPLPPDLLQRFDDRLCSKETINRSGVWRFREAVLPIDEQYIVTKPEGQTNLYASERLASYAGVDSLRLKHEGENPSGSFKDRGMTAGVTAARWLGMRSVACASTGNTSASLASYAATAGMKAFVFIPNTNVAFGKLSQALAYGATTIRIDGDFDDALALVEQVCNAEGVYLLNSMNPFRIEGQKAIGIEILQDLDWQVPDWIVLPGGNLGNNSAIYKGLKELFDAGLIDRLPRIGVIQAAGASPLVPAFETGADVVPVKADTRATAIRIGAPVSWRKSLRGVRDTNGTVIRVTDQEIFDAKVQIDRAGIGAEPASCASVAGIRKLVARGVIDRDDTVVAVLTGHLLKDPDAVVDYHMGELANIDCDERNAPIDCAAEIDAVRRVIAQTLGD